MSVQDRVEAMISKLQVIGADSQVPGLANHALSRPTEATRAFIDEVRELAYDLRDHFNKETT